VNKLVYPVSAFPLRVSLMIDQASHIWSFNLHVRMCCSDNSLFHGSEFYRSMCKTDKEIVCFSGTAMIVLWENLLLKDNEEGR